MRIQRKASWRTRITSIGFALVLAISSVSSALPFLTNNTANALGFGQTELSITSQPTASIDAGATTTFSVKEVLGLGGSGWTNALTSLLVPATITASLNAGSAGKLAANTCTNFGTTATVTVPAGGKVAQATFCYQGTVAGLNSIHVTANIPEFPTTIVNHTDVSVNVNALATPTNLAPNGTYTNNPAFTMSWNSVAGAIGYQYRTSNTENGNDLGSIIYCDGSVAMNDGCNGATYHLVPSNFHDDGTTVARGNSGTPEGAYYWQVRAIDAYGNVSAWSAVSNVTVDTSAPVVTVTPAAGSLLHGTVTFDITVTDNHLNSSADHIWTYLYNNGGTQKSQGASVNLSSGHASLTVDTTKLDDGLATLDVGKFADAAGNMTGASDTYFKNYQIDNTAPKIEIVNMLSGQLKNKVDLNGKTVNPDLLPGKDFRILTDEDGVLEITFPDGTTKTLTVAQSKNNQNIAWALKGSNGQYQNGTYTFVKIDAAGNPSSPVNVTIDTTAPNQPQNLSWTTSGGLVVADNGITNVYDGTASWDASSSTDVDHYVYKYWNDIAGNPYKVGSEYVTTTSSTSLAGVFNQGEGVHHFCVAAVDVAGNESACSDTFTITYDTTGPQLVLANPNGFTTTDTSITPNYSDPEQGNTYSWVGDSSNPDTDANVLGSGANELDPTFHVTVPGDYTYTLTATDPTGNTTVTTFSFTYAKPVVPAITPLVLTPTGAGNTSGNFSNVTFTNGTATTGGTTGVLGASTQKTDTNTDKGDQDILGATATPTKSSDGTWKVLGLAWYWWLLILAALAAIIWWFAAARRRRREA